MLSRIVVLMFFFVLINSHETKTDTEFNFLEKEYIHQSISILN